MPVSFLPNELLIKIFSVVSSHSDLFHALLCSRRFAEIVRPFLYHHITIETQEQRERLMHVREEDKKLLKKLDIIGTRKNSLGKARGGHSRSIADGVDGGCVKDLLVGELLDLSSIERLHVIDLNEGGGTLGEIESEISRGIATRIATNLIELSVSNHRNAEHIWNYILRSPVVPKLRQLGFSHNDRIYYIHHEDPGDFDKYIEDFTLPPTTPFSQLDLVVVNSLSYYDDLPELPRSKTLVILYAGPHFTRSVIQQLIASNPNVRFVSTSNHPLNYLSSHPLLVDNLRFLSLPYIDTKLIGQEAMEWLTEITGKGVEVRFDAREDEFSTSIIPQHFVDYMERSKRVECATGDAGEVEGMERLKI